MSVSFLYPLVWLAASTAVVPILLHLRRRQDSRVIHFSAMRFLDDQPRARRPFVSPRDWPLLVLRLVALFLLVAAFALPYLPRQRETVVTESRVYILDNTLSHQVDNGFRIARQRILDDLSRAGLEIQTAVVELTATARVVVGFGEPNGAAAEKVRALTPSFQRGSYLAAFRLANSLLQQSLGARRQIILLGDSQAYQWESELGVPPFLVHTDVSLPEVPRASRPNAALMDPAIRRVTRGDRTLAQATVRLFRQGVVAPLNLVFYDNGQPVVRRNIQIPGDAGSLTISAEWETDPREWLLGEIRIEGAGDPLPQDDRVVFSSPPIREGRVALLADSEFLRTALSREVMRGRWRVRALDAPAPAESPLRAADFDLCCVEATRLISPSAREFVIDSLESGRGVLLFVDHQSSAVAGPLREADIELGETEGASQAPGFRYVSMEHPLFRPFRSADFGRLDDVDVLQYRILNLAGGRPLAFSHAGDPLIFESDRKRGKLLVFAFSMDRNDTTWPLLPTFVPFLDLCFQHLRPRLPTRTAFEPGDVCVWPVGPESDVREVSLKAVGDPEAAAGLRAKVSQGQAQLLIPDRPGHYEIRYDDGLDVESVLAVNPPPQESNLNFITSPDVVATWQCEPTSRESSAESDEPDRALSAQEVLRQRLWWWLLLAGLGALFVETMWVSMRKAE